MAGAGGPARGALPWAGRESPTAHRREFVRDGLHLAVLVNFAVAQPLFDVLARGAEFFAVRRSEPIDVIVLVLLLCAGVPLPALLVEAVAGLLGRPVRRVLHGLLVACLAAAIVLVPLNRTEWLPGSLALLDAVVAGAALALACFQFRPIGKTLTVLAPAPLLFAGLFLLGSPVHKVLWPGTGPVAAVPEVAATTPVVMVVFDEFNLETLLDEHRRIDAARYPNFAALAREATWFRNATTVSDSTTGAVPAMLTGRYPLGVKGALPTATDYPHNLFTLLGGSYDLVVFESVTHLCQPPACHDAAGEQSFGERMRSLLSDLSIVYLRLLLPPDLAPGLPGVTGTWKDFAAARSEDREWTVEGGPPRRAALFARYLDTIRPSRRPRLFFLHVLLPHLPWRYLPSGKVYEDEPLNERWEDDEWAVLRGFQRHLLQVAFVDRLLGDLVARLKSAGLYDRSLIVITADHGVAFKAGHLLRPVSTANYQDIMPVPLFIKMPGQRTGVISDRNVETIDILPTIAAVLDVGLPWKVDGQPALGPHAADRPQKTVYNYESGERIVLGPRLETGESSARRNVALFERGGPDWIQRVGPYRNLVGRPVDALAVSVAAAFASELQWRDLYADFRLEGPFVPARVHGQVLSRGRPAAPVHVAVAVNGTIRAVTRTAPWSGRAAGFSAVVPETAFREGGNVVEIFVVSGPADRPRLTRTEHASARTYSLSGPPGSDRETLVSSDGSVIPVVPGAVRGRLDSATVGAEGLALDGWAADVTHMQPPEAVLVFVDGKFDHAAATTVNRYDVVKRFGSEALRRSGFSVDLPAQRLADMGRVRVRVFALSKAGVASELDYFWTRPEGSARGER